MSDVSPQEKTEDQRRAQREYMRTWRANNADKCLEDYLVKTYGITKLTYDAMLSSQGFRCAICFDDNPGKGRWHVDHCHTTGVVRGLLCLGCNVGIGHLKDDISIVQRAAAYLQKHMEA